MIPLGKPGDRGGVWSRQVEVRQVPGRQIRTEAVLTAFERPSRISFRRATGFVRPEGTYALVDLGGRSRLDFCLNVELEGARVLLAPLVTLLLFLVVQPTLPGDFARLRARLEATA